MGQIKNQGIAEGIGDSNYLADSLDDLGIPRCKVLSQEICTMHRLKDLYPAWFPYPSSWLKALGLSLWLVLGIRVILFWSAVTGLVLSELAEDPEPLVWSLLVGSALSTLAFIFLHYLFNRPKPPHPQWLPSGENIGSGLFANLVMFLATAATIPFIHFRLRLILLPRLDVGRI
ncbi:hypothetical protein HC928_07025 [bacterium]|nr:hypothetical protein [bacterium]